jgi:two-component sensor histidine kinase
MKYGALAGGAGPVVLSWRKDETHCVLSWTEGARGAQERPGFGTWLVEAALSKEPQTDVDYKISSTGVAATFKWPIDPGHRRLDLS